MPLQCNTYLQARAEDWLEGLDGVGEGDGDGGEGEVGGDVAQGVHGGRGEDLAELLLGDGPAEGGAPPASKVGAGAVDRPDDHVHRGDRPRVGEVLEEGLVGQVEGHIHRVPQGNETARDEPLPQGAVVRKVGAGLRRLHRHPLALRRHRRG